MRQCQKLLRRDTPNGTLSVSAPLRERDRIPHQKKPFARSRASLFLLGLSLAGLATWEFQAEKVKALEFSEKAIKTDWRSASFPVENFRRYSSPYGYRLNPDGAPGWGFHRGIDIAAPLGSYIRNWWTGEVVRLANDRRCGTMMVIRSGDWEHIYCHLKGRIEESAEGRYLSDRDGGIQIWQGQQIPAGTRIARVGMTGRTTGPHLHWGLKYANQYVDPAIVLQAMYAQQSGSPYLSRTPSY